MRRILIGILLSLLLITSGSARTELGTFYLGEKVDTIQVGEYSVGIVFAGFMDMRTMYLFFLSSPENPVFPGGYRLIFKPYDYGCYMVDFDNLRYFFCPKIPTNSVEVMREP